MTSPFPGLLLWFVLPAVLLRLGTLAVSRRNERRLKADGGVEVGRVNTLLLMVAHILYYAAAVAEGVWRAAPLDAVSYAGFVLYGFGIVMLLVVMRLLGRWWTVKLILARDHELVTHPLFRWVRHPNYYLNLLPEMTGLALALHAFGVLAVGLPCYAILLVIRIRQEDHAMKARFAAY